MRYRVSEDAERDLDEIFLYCATRASPEAADRVVDRITERFWLLGQHPDAGKPAGGIAARVRLEKARSRHLNLRSPSAPGRTRPSSI